MAEETKSLFVGNINSKLPPEMLSNILQFLPFSDLKVALLVCRSVSGATIVPKLVFTVSFIRRWKEVGEQPSLWAKLELHLSQFEEGLEKRLLLQVLTWLHLDFALHTCSPCSTRCSH